MKTINFKCVPCDAPLQTHYFGSRRLLNDPLGLPHDDLATHYRRCQCGAKTGIVVNAKGRKIREYLT